MAALSLNSLPHFSELEFDHVGSDQHRAQVKRRVMETWKRHWGEDITKPHPRLLLQAGAAIQPQRFQDLLQQRDDSPIRFKE